MNINVQNNKKKNYMNNLFNFGYSKFQPNWGNFQNGKKVQLGLLLDL